MLHREHRMCISVGQLQHEGNVSLYHSKPSRRLAWKRTMTLDFFLMRLIGKKTEERTNHIHIPVVHLRWKCVSTPNICHAVNIYTRTQFYLWRFESSGEWRRDTELFPHACKDIIASTPKAQRPLKTSRRVMPATVSYPKRLGFSTATAVKKFQTFNFNYICHSHRDRLPRTTALHSEINIIYHQPGWSLCKVWVSAAACFLQLWIRTPPGVWISVSCEWYDLDIPTTSWSLVKRSPTDCDVSLHVITKPQE